MLLLLIPIAWLAIVMIVLTGCRLAARADANMTRQPTRSAREENAPVLSAPGLRVWDSTDPVRLRSVASALSAPRPGLPGPAARRPNGHAVRGSRIRRHGTRSPARS